LGLPVARKTGRKKGVGQVICSAVYIGARKKVKNQINSKGGGDREEIKSLLYLVIGEERGKKAGKLSKMPAWGEEGKSREKRVWDTANQQAPQTRIAGKFEGGGAQRKGPPTKKALLKRAKCGGQSKKKSQKNCAREELRKSLIVSGSRQGRAQEEGKKQSSGQKKGENGGVSSQGKNKKNKGRDLLI